MVVLDRSAYDQKMKEIIDNKNTYRKLSRDPTTRIEKKISGVLRDVYRCGGIPDKLKDQLSPSYSNPPQIYGLPKIHKENTPLRPIVAAIGSPTYRLAKELARILSPLAGHSDSFVKNLAEFAREVRDMELGEEDVMLSFDVVSLFTRVPVDEAMEVIAQ